MLGWRLTVSAILIPAFLLLFWWDAQLGAGAPVLLILCLLLSTRSTFELCQLLKARAIQPCFEVAAVCNALVVLAAWFPVQSTTESSDNGLMISLGMVFAAIMLAFLLLMMFEAVRYRQPGNSMESLGAHLLTVLYAGGLIAVLAHLRWYPDPETGYFAIGSVIIAVKSGDIMAYTFGRLWGKRKMVPTLSPGKTWMGGFGAIVGSCLGTWLWFRFGSALFAGQPQISSLACILSYGATMGVVGLVGDLCESLIKRDVEKKDSATLMPGFGGLLDLLDSPLFAAPVAVGWWFLWSPVQ